MPHRVDREVPVFVLEVILGAALLVGIAVVISLEVGGLADEDDHPDVGLPVGRRLRSDDIDRMRFRVVAGWCGAVRGYRFADVDAVLDAVRATLADYEHERAPRAGTRAGGPAAGEGAGGDRPSR
jgi:DivIVA domain-containing protein